MSILSFPERGHWGDAKWRGNCSGHVYKDLGSEENRVDKVVDIYAQCAYYLRRG